MADSRRRSCAVPLVVTIALIAVLAAIVTVGPRLLHTVEHWDGLLPFSNNCTVDLGDETVGLDREQAQRATTAVALEARGQQPPNTDDIDAAVMDRLAEGPGADAGPSLRCRVAIEDELAAQELTETGLTPRAEALRQHIVEVFGDLPVGGFAPGGVDSGHQEDSTHYDGRAIDIFFRPVSEAHRREGWQVAHWLVAHADQFDIQYVIFDDQVWSARSFRGQWRDYPVDDPDNDILRHRDHVHVDVLAGSSSD